MAGLSLLGSHQDRTLGPGNACEVYFGDAESNHKRACINITLFRLSAPSRAVSKLADSPSKRTVPYAQRCTVPRYARNLRSVPYILVHTHCGFNHTLVRSRQPAVAIVLEATTYSGYLAIGSKRILCMTMSDEAPLIVISSSSNYPTLTEGLEAPGTGKDRWNTYFVCECGL